MNGNDPTAGPVAQLDRAAPSQGDLGYEAPVPYPKKWCYFINLEVYIFQ